MTAMEALRAELVAASAVTDLCGERIYPQIAKQGTDKPYITISVIADVPMTSHTGTPSTTLSMSTVQIDCWAETYLGAHALATAVDNVVGALSEYDLSAIREMARDEYDNVAALHRVSLDYAVWNGR